LNVLAGNPKEKISSGRLGLKYKDNIVMDSLNNRVSEFDSSVSGQGLAMSCGEPL
jgi:hypothetical protein